MPSQGVPVTCRQTDNSMSVNQYNLILLIRYSTPHLRRLARCCQLHSCSPPPHALPYRHLAPHTHPRRAVQQQGVVLALQARWTVPAPHAPAPGTALPPRLPAHAVHLVAALLAAAKLRQLHRPVRRRHVILAARAAAPCTARLPRRKAPAVLFQTARPLARATRSGRVLAVRHQAVTVQKAQPFPVHQGINHRQRALRQHVRRSTELVVKIVPIHVEWNRVGPHEIFCVLAHCCCRELSWHAP